MRNNELANEKICTLLLHDSLMISKVGCGHGTDSFDTSLIALTGLKTTPE